MYKLHTSCRACGLGKVGIPTLKESCAAGPTDLPQQLIPVLDLGLQPLANNFRDPTQEHSGFAPLKVMLCPRCNLGQLSVTVNQKELYSNYSYVTSQSETMRNHFRALVEDIKAEAGKGSVVEIGSNDGTLLAYMKEHGFGPVLGIDPAENLDKVAKSQKISTICNFFCYGSAHDAVQSIGQPDIVIARHVFCHIDSWEETIRALELLCKPETVVCIEVPHVMETLRNGEWDTIYHEHLSYLSIRSMQYALKGSKLHVHAIKEYPIHGGAIVLMLRRNDWTGEPDSSVTKYLAAEKCGIEEWRKFAQESEVKVMQLSGMVRNLVAEGKTVVGYGASAKSTVWVNACGFTKKELKYICDSTPQKMYRLSPGTNIPIVDDGALTRDLPDYAVCFAWNFSGEIMQKERLFRERGGKWILPVPNPVIV